MSASGKFSVLLRLPSPSVVPSSFGCGEAKTIGQIRGRRRRRRGRRRKRKKKKKRSERKRWSRKWKKNGKMWRKMNKCTSDDGP